MQKGTWEDVQSSNSVPAEQMEGQIYAQEDKDEKNSVNW